MKLEKMQSPQPILLPLLMSGPFGPLFAALLPFLAPLLGPLSAAFTGRPAVMSFVALIQALLSGKTLLPLEKGVRALPVMLATAVAEANERPTFSNSAFDLLNSYEN